MGKRKNLLINEDISELWQNEYTEGNELNQPRKRLIFVRNYDLKTVKNFTSLEQYNIYL